LTELPSGAIPGVSEYLGFDGGQLVQTGVLRRAWGRSYVWTDQDRLCFVHEEETQGQEAWCVAYTELGVTSIAELLADDLDGTGNNALILRSEDKVAVCRVTEDGPASFACVSLRAGDLSAMTSGDFQGNGRAWVIGDTLHGRMRLRQVGATLRYGPFSFGWNAFQTSSPWENNAIGKVEVHVPWMVVESEAEDLLE
jgi:hypothetical protein